MNHFNIHFTDLIIDTQEKVKSIIRGRIREDKERMAEIKQTARDKRKDWRGLSLADRFNLVLDDEVEKEVYNNFQAKGEV